MASSYPTTLDTTSRFPTDVTDDTDSKAGTPRTGLKGFLAQWVDDTGDAIVKIEAELGTLPRGTYNNVSARMDALLSKTIAQAASTANITISPGGASLVVDGVTMVNDDRLLLKDQTAPAENGLYTVSGVGTSVTLVRSTEANLSSTLAKMVVSVVGGAVNGDSQWQQVTDPPITVGTTAVRWTRMFPSYTPFQRNPWAVGASPLVANMDRREPIASVAQTAITAITSLHGGMVLRAGTTYTNINTFCTATGSGALTTSWYALVRQSDRATLQRTANTTVLPSLGVVTRALQATLVVDVDTPVWVAWGQQVATTSSAYAGLAAIADALVRPFYLAAPIFQGNSTTAPTSTPPTVGAVLGAPTTSTSPLIYYWLT